MMERLKMDKELAIQSAFNERLVFTKLSEEWAIEKKKLLQQASEVKY
jgi:hypothetical protein